jgi:AcrR family transcriptional regulator
VTNDPCGAAGADALPRNRPGRPRNPATHAAILTAAEQLLGEAGYAGMTVEAIAERAGTSKATIYRWWDSKEELLLEALDPAQHALPFTPTGVARDDLVGILEALVRTLPPRACSPIARLVGAMADSAHLAATLRTKVIGPRRAAVADLLRAAVATGDLPGDLDLDLAVDQLVGPLLYRHLVSGDPIAPDIPARLVDAFFSAHPPPPREAREQEHP